MSIRYELSRLETLAGTTEWEEVEGLYPMDANRTDSRPRSPIEIISVVAVSGVDGEI
jgi:hypothetical protein